MPFNATAYYRNKYRAEALEQLAKARRIKAGLAERPYMNDSAYWLSSAVRHCRISWRLYLINADMAEAERLARNANRPSAKHRRPHIPQPFRTRL